MRGWHGDLTAAVPEFEDALILCERAGDIFRQYLIHGWRGQGYLISGRHREAEADLMRCIELGDQIGTAFHRGAFQAFRAKLRLLDNDVGEALRHSAEITRGHRWRCRVAPLSTSSPREPNRHSPWRRAQRATMTS